MGWYRPQSVEEAIKILEEKSPKIVCGGTDLFVQLTTRQTEFSQSDHWLDIQNLSELKKIERTDEGIEVGAAVTAAEIWQSPVLQPLPALQKAARVVGGWQIQNRASIGGNIANASPAGDMIVPLAAYQARIKIASPNGVRILPFDEIITGPKKTQLAQNEMILSVLIPKESLGVPQTFLRHDQRGGTDISLVSVAALVKGTTSKIELAQIAIGAAHYKPMVLKDLTDRLDGTLTTDQLDRIAEWYAENCQPISDIRASAEYRRAMVKVFVKKAITEVLSLNESL
ncbi:FAD binding domain-containing protein [Neobacillus muris]|uniref:FAD binding domain-containing protein n=1 Tax=Neobacillus muris TaxID=2941334 RepID=UPI00203DB2B3|nr:xanthine dehydrogenase family protein subunit M [Neobacillus muris]